MDTVALNLLSLSITIFLTRTTAQICNPSSCQPSGPEIRFPFHLTGRQASWCGFPIFDSLSCNRNNQTVLTLPTGDVIVKQISYTKQTVVIDPQFCLPNRLRDFSLVGTPFLSGFRSFTVFNCSSQSFGLMYPAVTFNCLGGENYTVVAMSTDDSDQGVMPSNCRNISTVSIPLRWNRGLNSEEIELRWFMPECRSCEIDGGSCGTAASRDPYDFICFRPPSHGLAKSVKYGIIIGLGIPSIVCIIGLLHFTGKKVRNRNQSDHQAIDISSVTIAQQPNLLMGLDEPTIKSYPKTVFGESRRLPKPNDSTCPICLSDYQPNDELRTIPNCNHYFHAECIDEWLSLNATCPLCRK